MQISLKLIQGINHAKSTVCIKFQLLVTFSSLFTASSSLSVFARSVLYHFGEENHDFDTDAKVVILECGDWKNTYERQTKEDYYICKFKTLQPTGINVKRGPFTKAFNKLF